MGFPYRVSAIAVGAAMSAETDGSHAVWFPDRLLAEPDRDRWHEAAGPLAAVVPDPTDLADPVVAATAALLATRRLRVGLLAIGLDDAERTARTIATLCELAPRRVIASIDARAAVPERDASARAVSLALAASATDAELILAVDDAHGIELAGALGRGWLLTRPCGPEALVAFLRAAPEVAGGVYLPIVVHEDELLARKALDGPLLSALGAVAGGAGHDAAEHIVVGTPDDALAALHALARAGVRRVVLDNLLPLGLPEEFEGAQRSVRMVLRTARLQLRDAPRDVA